jgi:hypothetical protein
MSVVTETRSCEECGKGFRVASDSHHTLCLPCQRAADETTHLALFCEARAVVDKATGGSFNRANPIDGWTVAIHAELDEESQLVAEIVAEINAREPNADPFAGIEKPMRLSGRFYGREARFAS